MSSFRLNNKAFIPSAFIIIILFVFLCPPDSFSAEWRVTPIRLELGKYAKSGAITVINEGEEKLHVQMEAMEWIQDAEGNDVYTKTEDIIFFPKIMVFEKKEERILRAGIKTPAISKEKTYRLFIEEIPEPKKAEGLHVAIAVRFGVPIFVKPFKEEVRGEIEKITLSKGELNIIVKNTGNTHFIINSITLIGKTPEEEERLSRELSGWYLLSGVSRLYTTSIPGEVCNDLKKIDVQVKTDKFTLEGKLDVDKSLCLP